MYVFLMAVSGTLAVSYEITWARMLGVAAGHGTLTTAVVVATFMGGLGLGGWLADRPWVARRSPRTVWAFAELAIAAFALAFPALMAACDPLITAAYRCGAAPASALPSAMDVHFAAGALLAHVPGPLLALGLQLAWAAALLLVPTTLMGLTLPLAARAGASAATLYAASSAGGATGALLAVFVLLPALGHAATVQVLAAASALVAMALAAVRSPAALPFDIKSPKAVRVRARPTFDIKRERGARGASGWTVRVRARPAPGVALAIAFAAGCGGMALQGVWTRALVLFLGSSTHAFSLILAVFIAGLAAGGAAARALVARLDRGSADHGESKRAAAAVLALCAIAAAASGPMLMRVPAWLAALTPAELADFGWTCGAQMRAVSAVTLPATLLLGLLWPLAERISGGATGRVSAANTAGAVLGTLVVPLVLLPSLGLAGSLALVAGGFAVAAAALWEPADGSRRIEASVARSVAVGGVAAVLAVVVPPFDPALLNCGPLVAGNGLQQLARASGTPLADAVAQGGRILFHREGAVATVAVREVAGHTRTLLINGKPDASSHGDLSTQRLLAHLPLALAPDARDVLVIGLGAGVTAGSVLAHPVRAMTVVEVSPEVVAASRYFHPASGAPLADPRTRLVVADGRTHVARTRESYDVITSEPTNPWISGVGALFTREFFAACRARLNQGGVMAQWLQAYGLSERDFASVVATFAAEFPAASLWRSVDGADYLLIGRVTPGPISVSNMRRALARDAVRADLAPIRVADELDLLGRFVCGPRGLALLAKDARLQSDDRLDLEFARPAVMLEPSTAALRRQLAAATEPVLEHLAVESTPGLVAALSLRQSRDNALKLLHQGELDSAGELIAQIEATCEQQHLELTFLKTVHLAAIDLLEAGGQGAQGEDLLEGLCARYPADPDYAGRLAALQLARRERASARATWQRLLALAPRAYEAHRGLAALDEADGDAASALAHWRAVQEARPRDPSAATAVVRLLARTGQRAEARRALQIAVGEDPGLAATIQPE